MKRKLLFLGMALAVLLAAFPQTTLAATNMLADPSFEEDADNDDWPDNPPWGSWNANWSYGGDGYNAYYENDPTHAALTGEDCVGLYGSDYALWVQDINTGFVIGGTYYHAFYAKDIYPGGSGATIDPAVEFWSAPRDSGGSKITTLNFPVHIPEDGKWHLVQSSFVVPAGTGMVAPIPLLNGGGDSDYLIDDAWFSDAPFVEGTASIPNPADGAFAPSTTDELSWTNPEQASPSEIITCDVYFTNNFPEYGKYPGDPNFALYADPPIVINEAVESVTLSALIPPIELEMQKDYYWRVDCYDPNKIGDPEKYPAIGAVWTFNTSNLPPEVEAGGKQKVWLPAVGSATVALDATVNDDGMPLNPGIVTLEWTLDSGSPTLTFDPDNTVEDPDVIFTTAGKYVLKLTADDGAVTTSDTVTIDVYDNSYTGLLAHWQLDETTGTNADDIVGNHDGTLVGDPTWMPIDGQAGGAIELDGDGDYIEILDSSDGGDPQNTTWADLAEEVTVSCWAKVSEFTADYQAFVSKGEGAYRIQRNDTSDNIWFIISTGDINAGVGGQLNVNDGKWHQITGTYDGETINLYIDGYPDGSLEYDGGVGTNESTLLIGENIGYERSFNGLMDEVRIYEIGLPADRVLADFMADGGANSCGQVYKVTDVNQDCYTNLLDFAEMAAKWLECSDITEPSCFE
jgi:hypothetical protein